MRTIAAFSPLLSREVDVKLKLQIGDKVNETEVRVSSKEYTQLSMNGENLGFEIKLVNEEEGNESFETTPTANKKPIARFFITKKSTHIGAGCNLNGYKFEKDLIITFLAVQKVA